MPCSLKNSQSIIPEEYSMSKQVLIAYASKHGATAEIAGKIAERLTCAGFSAETNPVKQVKDLSGYDAVVLGAAVYVGGWVKPFARFLTANQQRLSELPLWLFSSGPTGEGDPVELLQGWRYPEKYQSLVESIAPREMVVFHGALFPEKLGMIEKKMIETVKAPTGDFRDWDAISAWADKIISELNSN
jgi:menaquinone-dependent protoporphyrinogen oxidase